jgi:hypothetical protein
VQRLGPVVDRCHTGFPLAASNAYKVDAFVKSPGIGEQFNVLFPVST